MDTTNATLTATYQKKTDKEHGSKQAKAREPIRKFMKLQLGKKYRIATSNIRGTKKAGVRNELEEWMKQKK